MAKRNVPTTPKVSEVEKVQIIVENDGFETWDTASEKKTVNNPYWLRLGKNNMVLSKTMKGKLGNFLLIAFNKDTQTIRIKSAAESQPSVVKCENTKISAASFYKKFNIEISEEAEKYEGLLQDDGSFYVKIK